MTFQPENGPFFYKIRKYTLQKMLIQSYCNCPMRSTCILSLWKGYSDILFISHPFQHMTYYWKYQFCFARLMSKMLEIYDAHSLMANCKHKINHTTKLNYEFSCYCRFNNKFNRWGTSVTRPSLAGCIKGVFTGNKFAADSSHLFWNQNHSNSTDFLTLFPLILPQNL